jgi:uncharacterized protein (TIGR02996 family)
MTTADERAALYRNILADPDCDAARLIYADHLDEYGDGDADARRAEFIRVQCELARLGPPHKRPKYELEATPLKAMGDRHYRFCGYRDEGFAVGDRVDLSVHRPGKKPKAVYGFRVYMVRPRTLPHERDEVDVFVRLDEGSKPWAGAELQRREQQLLADPINYLNWTPSVVRLYTGNDIRYETGGTVGLFSNGFQSATFRRGFIESVSLTTTAWLMFNDVLRKAEPIRHVRLTTRPRFGVGSPSWKSGGVTLSDSVPGPVSLWVPIDDGGPDWLGTEDMPRVLAAAWKEITFELPPA